jgi:hypothetical protein
MLFANYTIPKPAIVAILIFSVIGLGGLIGPFLFDGRVLYGSMISWQFYPVNSNYFELLRAGIYPLFSFSLGLGFDALADSQQSLLHPVKIIAALLANDYAIIDTVFLMFHVVLLVISFGLCVFQFASCHRDIGTKLVAAAFGGFSMTYGIAVYANFIHYFFIAALSYGVLLFFLVDLVIEKSTASRLMAIIVTTTLMLLCGNFVMQWIILFSLTIYGAARLYFMKLSFTRGVPVLVAIIIGFILAAPQLIPTFEAMQLSVRSVAGGTDKFLQSAGPLQFLAYVAPGAVYAVFEYAPSAYTFSGANNVVEGIHYVGLIPVALFLCAIRFVKQMSWRIRILIFCALLMALRAMGIFSPLNILLNQLPVFGQFRFPVRSFFMLDAFICLVAAIFLVHPFDRESVGQMLRVLTRVIVAVLALVLTIVFITPLLLQGSQPQISLAEAAYLLASLFVAWVGQLVIRSSFLSHRSAVLALCFLALFDLSVHRAGAPTHWRSPQAEYLATRTDLVDQLCETAGANRVFVESIWPLFDLPIFPYRASPAAHYATTETSSTPELNGHLCTLTYWLGTSTLTPKSTLALEDWMTAKLSASQRRGLLPFIGFDHYGTLSAEAGRSFPEKEILIGTAPTSETKAVKELEQFVDQQPPPKSTVFNHMLSPIYRWLVASGLSHILPSDVRKPHYLPGVGAVIALSPPFSYIFFQDEEVIKPIAMKGSFVVFPESVVNPVTVIYIPIAFIVGLFVSTFGLAFAVIFLAWALRSRHQYVDVAGRIHQTLNTLAYRVTSGLHAVIQSLRLQKFIGSLTAVVGIGILGTSYFLGNGNAILGMMILAVFLAIFYHVADFVSADQTLSQGLTVLVAFSYLLGHIFFICAYLVTRPELIQRVMKLIYQFS